MAWKRYHKRSYNKEDDLVDISARFLAFGALGAVFYFYSHPQELMLYLSIAVGVLITGYLIYRFVKRRKKVSNWNLDDEKTLYMLKGMLPAQFEHEIAEMFGRLGYETNVVGGANDGGIDVIAHKSGKKYFIQCKKFMTREVTPHDVRDFLGAITNVNGPAEKGFFVTTGNFTMMAERAAEGNPRIELIDGLKLIEYYKASYGDVKPADVPIQKTETKGSKICPQCGGVLELRTAHQGERAGQQFWGCSNFPKCKHTENFE